MRPKVLIPILLTVASAPALFADSKNAAFLEPASAGPEFVTQGEYTGDNYAAQVIALGGGKFHLVGWSKGLPGAAADSAKDLEADSQLEGEKITFNGNGWKITAEDGALAGTHNDGRFWKLKHIIRESPTLGAKPPAGAVVLFDGSDASAWNGGKIDDRKLLAGGTKSKQAFGDMVLHVEFRTPFMPTARGQGRGNSGIYLQDRYECQVLDSFGLNGEFNETGAIYHISKPRLNMCFPPLSWQTYDIEFQSARYDGAGKKTANAVITSKLNGVLVQDHVEAPHTTTSAGAKEGPEPQPIQLQNHGTPVFYRNIWVVEKK